MDIAAWLTGLGLERYKQAFGANDVDGGMLRSLTGGDLKDIGVASLGHRKKLLDAIAVLNGASAPPPASAAKQTDAERRQLTVMFIDLAGSTALSAKLDPEDMREIIRLYQNTVAGEISRLEGHVAKFMGDGVLAYFGWPKAHEDEAERAVRAGLAVTQAMNRLQTPTGDALQARIGIATGLVVVGDLVGEGAAQEHAVVGDTPNLAARLQGAAEPGTVVIAEATRRLLGDAFALRDLGAQAFKGIQGPTAAFAVLGERALESRFAARHGGGVAAIVGRDQELGLLQERWRQASSGEGQVLLLTGEAGIGKSRITEALVDAVANEPHFLLRYQCSPYNSDSALYPVIQHLTFAAGFTAEDNLEHRLERLEALLAKGSDDIGEAAPLMAALLSIDGESRYGALMLTPQQRRNRTLAVLIDRLAGLAKRKPVLWVIEDAHWIDPTTLELIELALDRVQGVRVLMLITARPTFVASFASHPVVRRLTLNRLARAATQAIVLRITYGKRLPDALLDEIAAKTDGVPLFVEEMTKAVIESGVLREETDAYHLDGPLSALAIPATLHDSLMARLDRLQPVKEVAQTAAVIGRSFDHRTITALAAMPEAELTEAMRKLAEAELVFRRGTPPDASYLFKHALVRDAAYESLLKSKRITLHSRLLDVLEHQDDTAPEVKAQHAEAAGLTERALGYWEQAGDRAETVGASAEAAAYYRLALNMMRDLPQGALGRVKEPSVGIKLGNALMRAEGYNSVEGLNAYKSARLAATAFGNRALDTRAAIEMSPLLFGAGQYREALTVLTQIRKVETAIPPATAVGLITMLGAALFSLGDLTQALRLFEEAVVLDNTVQAGSENPFGGGDVAVSARGYGSWAALTLGEFEKASHFMNSALAIARERRHEFSIAWALQVHGRYYRAVGDFETAIAALDEAKDICQRHGFTARFAIVSYLRGGARVGSGDIDGGLEEMQRGLKSWQSVSGVFHLSSWLCDFADCLVRNSRISDAELVLSQSERIESETGERSHFAELLRVRGLLKHAAGDREQGREHLLRAVAWSREKSAKSLELRAAADLVRLGSDGVTEVQDLSALHTIVGCFPQDFVYPDLSEARRLIAGHG